jgi:[protein-PII] uridylyltransferase
MTSLAEIRDRYRADKEIALSNLAKTGISIRRVNGVLRQLAQLTDATLKTLWVQADLDQNFSLVAVGGFGRQELFPKSDIDVLVLMPNGQSPQNDEPLRHRIESFISSCWDVGLEIGSSVRTVAECLSESAKDVTVQTALLESRLITGSALLFQSFHQQFL